MRIAPALLLLLLLQAPGALAQMAVDQVYPCVVEPSVTVKVGVPVVGLLAEVMVDRGDYVVEGQVIARLNDDLERATIAFNEARAATTAGVEADRARLQLARQQLERAQELLADDFVSEARVDELLAEVAVGRENVRRAENDQELARLELERSRILLDQRTIRSPVEGIVVERVLGEGEYVHQEAYIVEISAIDPLHINVVLPVETFGAVAVGDQGRVKFQQPIDVEREARVDVVDKILDAASGTYAVRLVLENPNGELPAGVRCTVEF